MLTLLAKLLSILNSDAEPNQIASAVALAMLAGFNPIVGIMGALVLLAIICLRVNLSTFLALLAVFSAFSLLLAPVFAMAGEWLLTHVELQAFWTSMYQTYWFRLFDLNHTLVLGSIFCAVILFLPVFLLAKWLIVKYRAALKAFVEKFKVIQSLKASKFYRIYETVHG